MGAKTITKALIRTALIGAGLTIPGGVVGYIILELLYQTIAPGELNWSNN